MEEVALLLRPALPNPSNSTWWLQLLPQNREFPALLSLLSGALIPLHVDPVPIKLKIFSAFGWALANPRGWISPVDGTTDPSKYGMWGVTLRNPNLFGLCLTVLFRLCWNSLKFPKPGQMCKDFQIFEPRDAMSWLNFILDSSTAQIFQPSHSTPAKSPVFQGTLTGKCGQADFSAVQPLLYLKHCSEKKKIKKETSRLLRPGKFNLSSSHPFLKSSHFLWVSYFILNQFFFLFYHTMISLFCHSLMKKLPELIQARS